MKKLFIIAIIGTSLMFQNCNTKEKQEKTDTLNDPIVTETVVTDTITASEDAVIKGEIPAQVEKTTTVVTTKVPGKTVTQKKTETKVNEATKVQVETKVVVTEQPKKVVEAETPVKVVAKAPTAPAPTAPVSTNNWVVPAKYLTMKNPIAATTDAAIGKSLYTKHCKSCHGSEGYGDGTKAKEMKGDLGDFSTAKFQKQTDGALFYKTSFGRDDMPEFTKKLPSDGDRWLIVNYMRTLKQ